MPTESLPRQIPEVSIKLDSKVNIQYEQTYNVRDFLHKYFQTKNAHTTSAQQYREGDDYGGVAPMNAADNQDRKFLKAMVERHISSGQSLPTLTSLNGRTILTPQVLRQATELSVPVSDRSATPQADDRQKYRFDQTPTQGGATRTWTTKKWTAFTSSSRSLRNQIHQGNLMRGDPVISRAHLFTDDVPSDIRTGIISHFLLLANQPFAFHFGAQGALPPLYHRFANSPFYDNQDYAQFYPPDQRDRTSLEVTWGSGDFRFKIVQRSNSRNIDLYQKIGDKWDEVSLRGSLGATDSDENWQNLSTLIVYPMGHNLFIMRVPKTGESITNFLVADFEKEIIIPETSIEVYMYGGKSNFAFSPIVHPQEFGIMVSPTADTGMEGASVAYPNAFFLGKKGADRESPQSGIDTSKKVIDFSSSFHAKDAHGDYPGSYLENQARIEYQLYVEEGFEGTDILSDIRESDQRLAATAFPDLSADRPAGQFRCKWVLKLVSEGSTVPERVISPVVDVMQITVFPSGSELELSPNPQIDHNDIRELTINETVQGINAVFRLNNRTDEYDIGRYTHSFVGGEGASRGNFTGVKPVTIRGGIKDRDNDSKFSTYRTFGEVEPHKDLPIRFKGFIVSREYVRPDSARSDVLCTCEDVSRRAKDHITINLPIFDGWCNLAVIYFLARDSGYTEDEILLDQDRGDPEKVIKIADLLRDAGSDPENFSGPCFDGHVDGIPTEFGDAGEKLKGLDIAPEVVHALMPLNTFRQQPNYMFPAGQNTWQCMQSVREFSGFYLYANAFGNILYQPAEVAFEIKTKTETIRRQMAGGAILAGGAAAQVAAGGVGGGAVAAGVAAGVAVGNAAEALNERRFQFAEIPKSDGVMNELAYNQFMRQLSATANTQEVRNAVQIYGLIPMQNKNEMIVDWNPHIVTRKWSKAEMEEKLDQPEFVPWLRWAIMKNPHWIDPARNKYLLEQYFARMTRPFVTAAWGAWGHPGLYAYEIVQLDEIFMDETGVDGGEFITTGITHNFRAGEKSFTTEVTGELIIFGKFDFSPKVYANKFRMQSIVSKKTYATPSASHPHSVSRVGTTRNARTNRGMV